jgi:hypothetical protein
MSFSFMPLEDVSGELAARDQAHVQLQEAVVVGRVGNRKRATLAVLQQELDVLAGEKLQALVGRQLQFEHDHVVRHALDRLHPAGHDLDRDVASGADFAALQHQVRERLRATEQGHAGGAVRRGQGLLLRRAVVDQAVDDLALAGAAGAVAATIRKREAGVERRLQNGIAAVGAEAVSAGLKGDAKGAAGAMR